MNSICKSNERRKHEIAQRIVSNAKRVGIYRLQMKKDSDNIRGSAMAVVPGTVLCKDLKNLYDKCDIILANRVEAELLWFLCIRSVLDVNEDTLGIRMWVECGVRIVGLLENQVGETFCGRRWRISLKVKRISNNDMKRASGNNTWRSSCIMKSFFL